MSEVGTEAAVGRGAANSVTIDARRGLEHDAAVRRGCVEHRWPLLRRRPALEIGSRLDDYAEQHHRMLGATILAALPEIGPRDLRIYPHRVPFVRDHVSLARKTRHPEAMRDVGGLEIEKCRRGTMRITQRYMKFVGSDDTECRVAELPPPLMSDHVDAQRSRRPGRRLNHIDGSRRDQDENEYNDDRHRGPSEFDRIAAVNLRRLAAIVAWPRAKANHAVGQ